MRSAALTLCWLFIAQIPAAQAGNGDNHAVSALKFRMLRHFLQLGYSVLLSDVVRIHNHNVLCPSLQTQISHSTTDTRRMCSLSAVQCCCHTSSCC